MKIKIFTPPRFNRQPLDMDYLDAVTDKKWQYSGNGRSSIYHLLKDLNIEKILIPVYICSTVLIPLKQLGIEPIFYDLDTEDLNPSLISLKELSKKHNIKTVLIASMYGNPANMVEIEKYCKENHIFLIDDAAQSFGAKLDNRFIGTFGDGGFFSFSPGKPTATHMGSFFWSNTPIDIERTNHCFIHYIKWLNFYYNRYKIYEDKYLFLKKKLSIISLLLDKFLNRKDDNICQFEKDIIGGVLRDNLEGRFEFRNKYSKIFFEKFKKNRYFRVLKSIRGISHNHKLILIFNEKNIAKEFIAYLNRKSIYASNGYRLLADDLQDLPNAKNIDKKVVELPIEKDESKMNYLFDKVEAFEYSDKI